MRKLKKLLTVCFTFVMATTLLTGCGSKEVGNPEDSMKAFYQLLVCHNTNAMTELGVDAADAKETLTSYKKETKDSLKKNFQSANVAVTDADVEKIYAAISDAMSNLEYNINVTKSDDSQASIKVSTQTLDYVSIIKKATTTTKDSLKTEHIETKKAAKDLLVTNICKGFKEYTPATTKASETFVFTKQKVKSGKSTLSLYFPDDATDFGTQLINLVINQ